MTVSLPEFTKPMPEGKVKTLSTSTSTSGNQA